MNYTILRGVRMAREDGPFQISGKKPIDLSDKACGVARQTLDYAVSKTPRSGMQIISEHDHVRAVIGHLNLARSKDHRSIEWPLLGWVV